ncbi:MAG: hypothetical protein ACREQX_18285 [Candidatus Binataceae bacterium]
MKGTLLVKVTDLATSCLTRPRGDEAYEKIRRYLDEYGSVDLDLDATEAPSSSFLDEIALRLQGSDLLDAVTFVTRKDRVRKRLSMIAGIRQLTLHFKPQPDAIRQLVPADVSTREAEYEQKPTS